MTVAELSQDLVWAAATALTVALVAFAIDLTRLAGRPEAEADAHDEGAERTEVLATAAARGPEGLGPAAAGGTPPASPSGPGAVAPAPPPAAPAPSRQAANIGISVTWLGTALLLVATVTRGIAAGRAPWANMYEFTLVGA